MAFPLTEGQRLSRFLTISFDRQITLLDLETASLRYHVSSIDHFTMFISLPRSAIIKRLPSRSAKSEA